MEIVIDGNYIFKKDDFFDQLYGRGIDFGSYFGRNLSAFNDYIDLLEGRKIIWNNIKISRERLPDFVEKIIDIINQYNNSIKYLDDFKNREITLILN